MPSTTPHRGHHSSDFDAAGGLQAVLWDMDGTIVDTEPYWIEAEKSLVGAFGGVWTDADAHRLVGQALPTSARMLQDAGVPLGVREIIDTLSGHVCTQVSREVPWRPGARELLEDLARHRVPCAMVTMSEGPLAGLVASAVPEGTFSFLVTGETVARGKPHPEPYLTAFGKLADVHAGLEMARVVAIEDSVPGATSAAASGAATIAVPHVTPVPEGEWTLWESLVGVDAHALDAFVRARLSLAAGAR